MSDEQIKQMVNRFLSWKLPEDFNPDAGIVFTPPEHGATWWPVGTNLLTATQAEAMIRHLAGDMTYPKEEIKALAKSHPVPSEEKLERRMRRIDRMTKFYAEKAPEAPEKQGLMFAGFVSALVYAATMIKMYRKLTRKIAELAEEAGSDEKSNDSI